MCLRSDREFSLSIQCQLWKKQCNELTMQKQAMEKRSELLFAENRRLIEEKDVRLLSIKERTILLLD